MLPHTTIFYTNIQYTKGKGIHKNNQKHVKATNCLYIMVT